MKFVVDANVGKLAKWLRLMGHDATFFDGRNDADMILIALHEERVILTRDTHVMERGVISSGKLRALLIEGDQPGAQILQVIRELNLDPLFRPFTVCLECNEPLQVVDKAAARERIPPYVFRTQDHFVECSKCLRVYWRGTHWQSMFKKLERLLEDRP